MTKISRIVIAVIVVLSILGGGLASAEEYRLGPGDVLSISVWGFEELSAGSSLARLNSLGGLTEGFIVRPDGKISFPLIGDVSASGLSVSQFNGSITQALQEYLNNPKVTVNIIKFRTTRVYVLGEVNKPGMCELEKSHKMLDAIGMAGGYTQYAAKKSVYIIRSGRTDQPIKINLLQLLKNGDMTQNYTLAEGDVVYLTSNNKMNFAQDIVPLIMGAYDIKHYND